MNHLNTIFQAGRSNVIGAALLSTALLFGGCGHEHKEGEGHDHGKEATHGKDDGHGHEEESLSGASFKAGKGVLLTDETRKILGVEVADVTEQKLSTQIHFNVQVFGEKHYPAIREDDHTACDVHASGVLSSDKAATFREGEPVQIQASTKTLFAGVVLGIGKTITSDESEIIIGITNAAGKLKPGDFLSTIITLPREQNLTVVPRAALLHSVDGTFVYAVNGDAYFRTSVKVGAESEGVVEISDGLLSGDQVVTKATGTLWLIELRATKGGGGCTSGH